MALLPLHDRATFGGVFARRSPPSWTPSRCASCVASCRPLNTPGRSLPTRTVASPRRLPPGRPSRTCSRPSRASPGPAPVPSWSRSSPCRRMHFPTRSISPPGPACALATTSLLETATPVSPARANRTCASPSASPLTERSPSERLVDAVAGPAAVADQLAAVAAQLAQLAEIAGRHIAGPAQAELANAGQPQAVRHVAVAALHLLDEPAHAVAAGRCRRPRGRPRAFQKMPVASIVAAVTRWLVSRWARAASPAGKALNCRVLHCTPPPGWHTRTEAVICIVWTSSPAARACTTCISSALPSEVVTVYPPCSGGGQSWPVGNPSAREPGPGTARGSRGRSGVSLETEVEGRSPLHHWELRPCARLRSPQCYRRQGCSPLAAPRPSHAYGVAGSGHGCLEELTAFSIPSVGCTLDVNRVCKALQKGWPFVATPFAPRARQR